MKSGKSNGRIFGMHPDDEKHEIELTYELGPQWWNNGYGWYWCNRLSDGETGWGAKCNVCHAK